MLRKPWSTRFVLWAAMCALLLKAAVPMLASASAQMQGKALVEVCTVYGVAMVALGDQSPQPEHGATHASDHCALTALMALAAPGVSTPAVVVVRAAAPPWLGELAPSAPDATAAWAARQKHGPPRFA